MIQEKRTVYYCTHCLINTYYRIDLLLQKLRGSKPLHIFQNSN